MSYFVYILSNKNRSVFYVGVTNDISRRVGEHKADEVSSFTKRYNCYELLYYEEYSSNAEAIGREKILKKFRRDWKFQLITAMNPNWEDLSKDW